MASKNPSLFLFLLPVIIGLWSLIFPACYSSSSSPPYDGGEWVLLQPSVGVSAMHMQLLKNNKVIIFDRMDMGPSNLSLPNGTACVTKPKLPMDCTAHSLLYDVDSNSFRPLLFQTDTWCSSGSLDSNGALIQTGGYDDGERVIRTFTPCDDESCNWNELGVGLTVRRWYATNQILPDGRVIIIGGRRAYTYEFFPKSLNNATSSYYMSFLKETMDRYADENNLYPFVHLLPDGNLYIFANKRSILFDYNRNLVVKEFPVIPGDFKRNYPSTGSSVLLPLRLNGTELPEAEVMVCGGAPNGAFNNSSYYRVFVSAANTCGRLRVTDPNPQWVMEEMPMPRVMSDMLLLPTGEVIIINGAMNGTAGWEDAVNPVFNPVLYRPNEPDPTRKFSVLNPSKIPRMYHSSALLLPDGRILVGGSNPHQRYNFTGTFPTDLSLEAYSPYYLNQTNSIMRPTIITVESKEGTVSYLEPFAVTLELNLNRMESGISVVLITPSFNTHSYAMNQRMLVLDVIEVLQLSTFAYKVTINGPHTATVAPPGYYMLFVVHAGIPSHGVWVQVVQ
ncbi:aldehyde oxidase GLOX [Fagus crenata]